MLQRVAGLYDAIIAPPGVHRRARDCRPRTGAWPHWRTWVLVLLAGLLLYVGAVQADETSPAEFARARQLWQAAGVHDYQFTLARYCECFPEEPIRVVVKNDAVVSASFTPSGKPVAETRLRELPTLNGIFDTIDAAYAKPAASVQLRLNPELGYPERVFIDYDKMIVDEELIYGIRDFAH